MPRGVSVRTTEEDLLAFVRSLPARLTGRTTDPTGISRRVLRACALKTLELLQKAYRDRARGVADESGLKWVPLKKETVERKKRLGQNRGILIATEQLVRSFAPDKMGVYLRIIREKAGSADVGTDVPYAVFHHRGTRTLPKRPLWPDPADWPARWWREILRAMSEELGRALSELREI